MKCASKLLLVQDRSEIDKRAGHRRHGYPAPPDPILDRVPTAPGDDSGNMALVGGDDFRPSRRSLEQPKQVGRRPPRKQRVLTTSLDRSQVRGHLAWRSMTDTKDPAVNADEGANADTLPQLCLRHPGPQQLFARHDPMRLAGQPGKNFFDRGRLGSHDDL
jgi:hypothetical protein